MNKFITTITILGLFLSLNVTAQSKYPDPPENNSKEVMDKYQKAVDQWYLENPKEEEKTVSPEINIEEEIEESNLSSKDIPKSASAWKLSKIEVVESGVIDEQLNEYQQNYVNRLNSTKLIIYIDQDKFFYIRKSQDSFKKFAYSINGNEISLKEDNCPQCKTFLAKIITFDSSSIIMEKNVTDDKGKSFSIRISYYKQ